METSRIAELLQPFLGQEQLSGAQLTNISMYIDILVRWNARLNLTAVREPEEMVTRHFGESLFAACKLFPRSAAPMADSKVVDVGSGAGFPGLPIKTWAPDTRLTLIESNGKKSTFLREVIRSLAVTGADVFSGRAEDFPAASANVVTLRAVERFERAVPAAARLIAPGGRMALLIGDSQSSAARELAPGLTWQESIRVPMSTTRVLQLAERSPNW
jgi:16S rRNA (guanine527-N7)-methyltransferase